MHIAWKILAGAVALVVVVAIGVAIAISSADVNTLIGPINARVKAATGRELTIRGGASLAFSLEPKLVLRDVMLANAPWGTAPALVSAQRLELKIGLIPLLSRRFDVIELTLVDPVIALETNGTGHGNWEFGIASSTTAASPATSAAPATAFGNFSITGGTLTYRDAQSGHLTRVAIDKFALRARDTQSPMAAQFTGKVDDVAIALEGTLGPIESLVQQRWPYPVTLKGRVQDSNTAITTNISKDSKNYVLNDLDLRVGTSTIAGKFSIDTSGVRPSLIFDLAATTVAMADLPARTAVAPGATVAAAASAVRGSKIFSDTPVDFSTLRAVDANGRIAIGKLILVDGRALTNVKVQLARVAGRLDVNRFEADTLGGTLSGNLVIDIKDATSPTLTVRVNGNGLDLGKVLALFGMPREVRNGQAELSIDLALRGASPRAWAESATGNVRLVAGHATLLSTKVDLTSPLEKLFQAINPFRARDSSTELICAVIRLPFNNGVARVDRSVAIETSKLGVIASGTLDLRRETLDFTIQPRASSVLPVDIPQLADLVRFTGPIAAPEVKMDTMASIAAVASVGAAISTGGLSAIGQALWARAEDGGATPCQIALGQRGSPAAKGAVRTDASKQLGEIGNAVGRLFGK